MTFKDSGKRTEFETGARRDCQGGKGRMDLLPWRAIMELSRVYEEGSIKYGDRNWEKGIPLSRFADSGPRHFAKWMAGYVDEPHLDMAIWNFMSMLDTILRIKEGLLPSSLDDLPCNPSFQKEYRHVEHDEDQDAEEKKQREVDEDNGSISPEEWGEINEPKLEEDLKDVFKEHLVGPQTCPPTGVAEAVTKATGLGKKPIRSAVRFEFKPGPDISPDVKETLRKIGTGEYTIKSNKVPDCVDCTKEEF